MSDSVTLWRAIREAGSIDAYVRKQLEAKGFLVKRRATDKMSRRDLARYKKGLKAEAAERDRLRKEAWLAYKATHIVHLGEGVYWNDADDFDKWDHPTAEERRAENGLPDLKGPQALADALEMPITELRWLTWHRDAASMVHYRRFTIPKRDGSERAIWAPLPKLKAAQRWVHQEIVERLPIHGAGHGFIAGRSIATNAAPHTGSRVIVKMDLRDFFPTITLRRVKGVFRRAGYREQVATLLALLCTESPREVMQRDGETWFLALGPRSLPQGAPTSPGITNVVCLRMDRRLTGLAAKLGWRYTRYADDMTFSLPVHEGRGKPKSGQLSRLLASVKNIIEDEGFVLNESKTRVMRGGSRQTVTGLVVNGDGPPRVSRTLRRQLRAAVHNLGQGKPLPEGESIDRLRGYLAYLKMTDPELGATLSEALEAANRAT